MLLDGIALFPAANAMFAVIVAVVGLVLMLGGVAQRRTARSGG